MAFAWGTQVGSVWTSTCHHHCNRKGVSFHVWTCCIHTYTVLVAVVLWWTRGGYCLHDVMIFHRSSELWPHPGRFDQHCCEYFCFSDIPKKVRQNHVRQLICGFLCEAGEHMQAWFGPAWLGLWDGTYHLSTPQHRQRFALKREHGSYKFLIKQGSKSCSKLWIINLFAYVIVSTINTIKVQLIPPGTTHSQVSDRNGAKLFIIREPLRHEKTCAPSGLKEVLGNPACR